MESNRIRLGVVVPLANEQATVGEFLTAVVRQLGPADRVICVLDNASKDDTKSLVTAFGESEPRVEIHWSPANRCVVDAYFSGYRRALEMGCQWILEMDGGFSHDPAEIPRFFQAMESGVDFAAGSRFCKGGRFVGFGKRYLISWGGSLLTNCLLGTKMRDMTSGFECFSHAALEAVVAAGVESKAHFFQTEIRAMMHDWQWVEVPITYRQPSSIVGSASIFEALRILFRMRKQRRHRRQSAKSLPPPAPQIPSGDSRG